MRRRHCQRVDPPWDVICEDANGMIVLRGDL